MSIRNSERLLNHMTGRGFHHSPAGWVTQGVTSQQCSRQPNGLHPITKAVYNIKRKTSKWLRVIKFNFITIIFKITYDPDKYR